MMFSQVALSPRRSARLRSLPEAIRAYKIMQLTSPETRGERATDIWRKRPHPLDAMFAPKNVAVIGATESEGTVGRTVMTNLIEGHFGGTIYPVNPKRGEVLGLKAYPS